MKLPPFTTVVALDLAHVGELQYSGPTWAKNRQEIYKQPLMAFCDDVESELWWRAKISNATHHPDIHVVPWPRFEGIGQRHRMLSAFTFGVAEHVKTPWVFKIDTDTVCVPGGRSWPHPNWFDENEGYVWVGQTWSYTKPVGMWEELKAWASTKPEFEGRDEVPGDHNPEKNRVWHKCRRLISFAMFGRTSYAQMVADLAGPAPGPIPSHDTLWWYVAERLGLPMAKINMKKFGFSHGKHVHVRAYQAMEG